MRYRFLIPTLMLAAAAPLAAQAPRALTAEDYARAERFLGSNTNPLLSGTGVQATWIDGGHFWYRVQATNGEQFYTVDVAKRTRTSIPVAPPPDSTRAKAPPHSVVSPDGKRAAFIRQYNLWVKDLASGAESQLTTDGVKDYGYATNNAGWVKSDDPVLAWSPDSHKIATFQHDARGTSDMYLVRTGVGAPVLEAWKYPLPGDSVIFRIRRVFVDVDNARVIPFQMPADQHRSTICDHISCNGDYTDVEWYPDASALAFVSVSRDHKEATTRVADATTGAVRTVMNERVATQFESGISPVGNVNWRVLPASNQLLWWSQRSDWGHLYLYNLGTGALERPVTQGAWNVADVLRVDDKTHTLYVTGVGHEAGRDPYFVHFYKVSMDGKRVTLLTPQNANHNISMAPDGKTFVDTYSTPTTPPTTVLRDTNGKVLMTLEQGDVSKLVAKGWKPPTPIVVKARDGTTDLYGLMFTPTNMDPAKKYPVINHIYPGPQTGSVATRNFSAARGDDQALAELGFIVVEIDGMGTPWRSKTFQDAYYGDMADNTLPDQVAGMRELAQRYSFIDIDRAGIWGHSGGGFATATAMFRFPDFFKVGISESGNHDNRNYEDDWGERYQGLLSKSGPSDNYAAQANQLMAGNLKGKLLLAHGGIDNNVPPYNTYVVAEALEKANKDFDLLVLPNQRHGYGPMSPYMMRRRWDYFVKNLMGAEPPKEYEIGKKPIL